MLTEVFLPLQEVQNNQLKITSLQASNFMKKRLQHICFPVNIEKFLKTPILNYFFKVLLFDIKLQVNKRNTLKKVCQYIYLLKTMYFSNKFQLHTLSNSLQKHLLFFGCSRTACEKRFHILNMLDTLVF